MEFKNTNSRAILTVEEMSRADALTITGGVPGEVLMENAGTAVAREITNRWSPGLTVVLCGPGNNGGDGFVIARQLASAGLRVRVALLGDINNLSGDAGIMAGRWEGEVNPLTPSVLEGADLVVDAVFGAGLARPVEGIVADTILAIGERRIPCVSVDVPTGVDGDTGQVRGIAPQAALTVTFFRPKPGHLLYPGRGLAGEIVVADIGIPESVLETIAPKTWENGPELWLGSFPWPRIGGHKYDRGHAIAVTGGPAATGAARLAARAALRAGAGLVTLAVPPNAVLVAASHSTAVMISPFDGLEGLRELLEDKRKNVVLLGPGNGVGPATRDHVKVALELEKSCVLDADALTSFEGQARDLFDVIRSPVLCTPHDGEFARLFGTELARGKLAATRQAAQDAGAAVLYKGPDTVIAAPDGCAVINVNAPPYLATAGSGDVLAGIALGFMAQGMTPFVAGCAAAWLHGEAANEFGIGLIAEDIPEFLPRVLSRLEDRAREGSSD